jgi:hypothetical protein
LEEIRRAGREQWRKERVLARERGIAPVSLEEIRRQGREEWLQYRAEQGREVPRPAAAASSRESEHLASLSSRELWAQHRQINPPPVAQLVAQDPNVMAARQAVEGHQRTAAEALKVGAQAKLESQR